MKNSEFLDVLHSEIEASTGCTDPGSISLAVANAVTALGREPQKILVTVSPNIYKNAVSVGIPGTFKSGMELAAALGALINAPEKGLSILSGTTDKLITQAEEEVAKGHIKVTYGESPNPLYVKAQVFSDEDVAEAVIADDYSKVIEVTKNGVYIKKAEVLSREEEHYPLLRYKVKELYNLILSADVSDFDFLIDYARKNLDAAQKDIDCPGMCMGRLMKERLPDRLGC